MYGGWELDTELWVKEVVVWGGGGRACVCRVKGRNVFGVVCVVTWRGGMDRR